MPGYEAPVNLAYSQRNRSAACRIPMYSSSPKAKRIEFRCPDPSCNPYFAFSAMLMAAIDGIQNKIHPGEPLDKDIYDLPPEEAKHIDKTPASLEEAMLALGADHEFLLRGDVFTRDVIHRGCTSSGRKKLMRCDCAHIPTSFVYTTMFRRIRCLGGLPRKRTALSS